LFFWFFVLIFVFCFFAFCFFKTFSAGASPAWRDRIGRKLASFRSASGRKDKGGVRLESLRRLDLANH
jgi:hypothetical protein